MNIGFRLGKMTIRPKDYLAMMARKTVQGRLKLSLVQKYWNKKRLEYSLAAEYRSMRTLILGLGNPLVTDDSVGLRVIEQLKPLLADRPEVEISEDYWGGLRLMERMIGYEHAIVVDAIQTGSPPGTIHHLTADGIATQRSASAHDVNLATALEFGRQAGAQLPENRHVQLVGVEAQDILNFGEQCTPAVEAAIPRAVETVMQLLAALPSAEEKDSER
jgi:hydrogenase maturation protease